MVWLRTSADIFGLAVCPICLVSLYLSADIRLWQSQLGGYGLAFDSAGQRLVCDLHKGRVHVFRDDGVLVLSFGSNCLRAPRDVCLDPLRHNRLYVADDEHISVFEYCVAE